MPKSVLLVLTNPTEGQDAEFNRWYDDEHLSDVLKVTDAAAAQRFRINPALENGADFPWRYLAIYEIDNEYVEAFKADLDRRAGTEVMPLSPAFDPNGVKLFYAHAIGGRMTVQE